MSINKYKEKACLVSRMASPSRVYKGLKIYFATLKHKRFIASLPRAGTNYLYALLSALRDARYRDGAPRYIYKRQATNNRGKWEFLHEHRIPNSPRHFLKGLANDKYDRLSSFFFVLSHYPAIRREKLFSPSYMKPVVLIRHPVDAAKSLFHFYYDKHNHNNQNSFLSNEINQITQFYRYWGKDDRRRDESTIFIKYEELTSATKDKLSKITNHWSITLDDKYYEFAKQACTKENMKKRIPARRYKENKRVSVNDKEITKKYIKRYRRKIRRKTSFIFGYEINKHS